jgi:hypothetical protein
MTQKCVNKQILHTKKLVTLETLRNNYFRKMHYKQELTSTNKIFDYNDGGCRLLEAIMLTNQHTCHHNPGDSITSIRISQTFTQKGKCMWQLDYPTIKSFKSSWPFCC